MMAHKTVTAVQRSLPSAPYLIYSMCIHVNIKANSYQHHAILFKPTQRSEYSLPELLLCPEVGVQEKVDSKLHACQSKPTTVIITSVE